MDNNKREFLRWFNQAEYDLKAARDSSENGNYEWSCFQAEQSTEKALKGFLCLKGRRNFQTHSILKLINESAKYSKEFNNRNIQKCKELSQYYIPTRYVNGLPDDIPHIFYKKDDAKKCVDYAERILNLIKKLAGL